jgi:D-alanine-D-alanine ligase
MNGKVKVLAITEIKTNREFFDYQAKYENESEEITPAELTEEQVADCQQLTEKIYRVMNAKGFCRVDYILQDGQFKLLEINTIPGMSPNSIIPQQVRAAGLNLSDCLDEIVKEALRK